MPIGFGLGSSHASFVTMKRAEEWIEYYRFLIRDVPQPPEAALETREVVQSYIDRVDRSFQVLAQKLADYRPDLLIIIGGDQSEMFDDSNVPNLMIYLGEEAWGYNVHRFIHPSRARATGIVGEPAGPQDRDAPRVVTQQAGERAA